MKTKIKNKSNSKEVANIYYQVLKMYADHYEKEYGEEFYPQPHHFKQCRDFLDVQEGFRPIPLDEVARRLPIFFQDPFWRKCKHNISKFFEHFHRFVPEKARPRVQQSNKSTIRIRCVECETEHDPTVLCPTCNPVVEGTKEDALKAIEGLVKHFQHSQTNGG